MEDIDEKVTALKKEIGARVRELRKRAGFSNADSAAADLGVSATTLYELERGENWLSPELAVRMWEKWRADIFSRGKPDTPTTEALLEKLGEQQQRIRELEKQLEAVKKPAEQPAKPSLAAVEPSPVSPEEQRLLDAWRRMDEPQRSLILDDIRDFQIIDDERADPFSAAKAFESPVAKKPGSR